MASATNIIRVTCPFGQLTQSNALNAMVMTPAMPINKHVDVDGCRNIKPAILCFIPASVCGANHWDMSQKLPYKENSAAIRLQ